VPELPEVETIRRELEPLVLGRTLGEAWAYPHGKFLPALDASGGKVVEVGRRGKYLLLGLHDDRELVVHLGMTGSLAVQPAGGLAALVAGGGEPYLRAWWALDGDEALTFRDTRRFGRLAVALAGAYSGTLAVQGPDALDPTLTGEAFWRSLKSSRRAIKTQLLSQRPLAGVGNIYADEALWRARIDPRARTVSRARAAGLLAALQEVLSASLDHGGTTLRDYRTVAGESGRNQERLACYGRYGEPCFRCSTILRRTVLDGRTTTWCPTCQRR
jgi:formamidopyrimidine-DNA glycosylase